MLQFIRISLQSPQFLSAIKTHYPGSRAAPPGRSMAWIILEGHHVRGYIGSTGPVYALAARRRIGLPPKPPPPGTLGCFMFRLESHGKVRASEIISEWHDVAADAYMRRHGETITSFETMVDPAEVKSGVPGACFIAAGYRFIGWTTGVGAMQDAGVEHSSRRFVEKSRKMVFYKGPLARVPHSEIDWPDQFFSPDGTPL